MNIPEESFTTAVTVILRLPALFILEIWWRTDSDWFIRQNGLHQMKRLVSLAYEITPFVIVVVATLPLRYLVRFYMNLICAGLICVAGYAYWNDDAEEFDKAQLGDNMPYQRDKRLIVGVLVQILITGAVGHLMDAKSWVQIGLLAIAPAPLKKVTGILAERQELQLIHKNFMMFILTLIFFSIFFQRVGIIKVFQEGLGIRMGMIRTNGFFPIVKHLWKILSFGIQFFLFGMIMVAMQMYIYAYGRKRSVWQQGFSAALFASVVDCRATPLCLIGMSNVIIYMSRAILDLTEYFLFGVFPSNTSGRGTSKGLTMLLMVAKTDKYDLKFLEGHFLIKLLLYHTSVSLIQSMFRIVDPFLFALGVSYNRSFWKNMKAVSLCMFLGLFPVYLTYLLSQNIDLNFWLMIVVSYSLINSIQVIRALAVFTLLMFDSLTSEPWENLDDIIFFVNVVFRTFELILAIFVSYFGLSESFNGEWSWITYISYVLHTYANVYERLWDGWKSFFIRLEATRKVASLERISGKVLEERGDAICAICRRVMRTACVTTCVHMFHATCMRKWLFVNDTCPICRQDPCATFLWRTHLMQKNLNLKLRTTNEYTVNGHEEGEKEAKNIEKSLRAIYRT